MKPSDLLENAENCAQLAERDKNEPAKRRFKRMEEAWRALALEQNWLDGQICPVLTEGAVRDTPPM